MRAYIVHGAYGHPEENWFPWLKKELENLGIQAIVPKFPTPENQSLQSWMDVMSQYNISEEDILIGHSIAPALILRILEKQKVKAAFFVAGFIGSLDNPDFDKINKSFFVEPFDWENIRENCKRFVMFNSEDDPYLTEKSVQMLAEGLGITPIFIEDAGHFNAAAGYTEFPELLEKIKETL